MSYTHDSEITQRVSNASSDLIIESSASDSVDDNQTAILKYIKVEDHVEQVMFQISDYLAEQGRRDLFTSLTPRDVALLLYPSSYVSYLQKNVPNNFL